jgi:hypothetical protein
MIRRRYSASKGGHAPGHLRDALLHTLEPESWPKWWEALGEEEALFFYSPARQAWRDRLGTKGRAIWLTGQLWNCSDQLPGDAAAFVTECRGWDTDDWDYVSTYARAVRYFRSTLN